MCIWVGYAHRLSSGLSRGLSGGSSGGINGGLDVGRGGRLSGGLGD